MCTVHVYVCTIVTHKCTYVCMQGLIQRGFWGEIPPLSPLNQCMMGVGFKCTENNFDFTYDIIIKCDII